MIRKLIITDKDVRGKYRNHEYSQHQRHLKLWQSRLLPQNFVLGCEKLLRIKDHTAKLLMNILVMFSRRGRQIAN